MRALLLLLPFLASPALAQDSGPTPPPAGRTFQLPAGCEAYLTVQMRSCTVSHHFRCEADPEGWQRRVDVDEGGVSYFGAIDSETQWVESVHVLGGFSDALGAVADAASFTGLTATGEDSFDFVTDSPERGQTRFVGEDRLTGETVTIDGVTLDRTEYEITASTPDGQVAWTGHGQEFISRDWRMFLSGTSTYEADGETSETDDTPVDFIFPGERGFLGVTPIHGCGAVMSKAPAP